jgi:probable non-F420 flavinoid oxidoreductase
MIVGYHASHEQFPPSLLLNLVKQAEDCGFQAIMTSDHINPWSVSQGNAGNNWAWLGAAMAATSVPFGSIAIPGGWRYHPVVLAHMVATLAEMFPNRLQWLALGSGEALNEHVVGRGWPGKTERNERLLAGYQIMSALLRGETMSVHNPWFSAEEAKLWSPPTVAPALYGTALSAETSTFIGPWSDGLVTVWGSSEKLLQLRHSFEENGGRGKPLALQLQVSWAKTKEEARDSAWKRWRNAAAAPEHLAELKNPEDFDAVTSSVKPEDMDAAICLVTQPEDVFKLLAECSACGFDEVYIHNVGSDQEGFLHFMKQAVLPHLS